MALFNYFIVADFSSLPDGQLEPLSGFGKLCKKSCEHNYRCSIT